MEAGMGMSGAGAGGGGGEREQRGGMLNATLLPPEL